jgi:hypothetical protein
MDHLESTPTPMRDPPAPGWADSCLKNIGLNHDAVYGDYTHCPYCRLRNPKELPDIHLRQSSLAPDAQQYRYETPALPQVYQSSRQPPPLAHKTTPQQFMPFYEAGRYRPNIPAAPPALQVSQQRDRERFASTPQVAQSVRKEGYKNQGLPLRHAGSTPVSKRTNLGPTTVAQPKAYSISLKLYISEITERQGLDFLDNTLKRHNVKSWGEERLDHVVEQDWGFGPFADWIMDRNECSVDQVKASIGYKRHILCRSVVVGSDEDDEEDSADEVFKRRKKNVMPKISTIGDNIDRNTVNLEEKLAYFQQVTKVYQIHIVIEVDRRTRRQSRAASIRQSIASSPPADIRATTEPGYPIAGHGLLATVLDDDTQSLPDDPTTAATRTFIKPEWTQVPYNTKAPPLVLDLTTSSPSKPSPKKAPTRGPSGSPTKRSLTKAPTEGPSPSPITPTQLPPKVQSPDDPRADSPPHRRRKQTHKAADNVDATASSPPPLPAASKPVKRARQAPKSKRQDTVLVPDVDGSARPTRPSRRRAMKS